MNSFKKLIIPVILSLLATACQTTPPAAIQPAPPEPATTLPITKTQADKPIAQPVAVPMAQLPTLRIKAGSDTQVTDSKGNLWLPDSGFDAGGNVDRDTPTTNTTLPELFKSEHHSMTSWSTKLPNGDYTLKLFFAENFSGVTDDTGRIFSYTVLDGSPTTGKPLKEIKDFSIFKAAGGSGKAYVESIPVSITSGQLSIKFTEQTQHSEINAIEITPR